MLKKGFWDRAYSSKEKGDNSKKIQGVSDKAKSLNVVQKAADTQTNLSQDKAQQSKEDGLPPFSKGFFDKTQKKSQEDIPVQNLALSPKKEGTKTLEHAVKEKAQHSDVGSSSDSCRAVDIPANFEYIGGNTELAKAKVILLGEAHISQHHKDIVNFINTHAEDGDIVLVEGEEAHNKMGQARYALENAVSLGVLDQADVGKELKEGKLKAAYIKWLAEEKITFFSKNVDIYGWDDMEANNRQHIVRLELDEISKKVKEFQEFQGPQNAKIVIQTLKDKLDLRESRDKLNKLREEKMIETINEMRKNFPNKRIFTIAGKDHVLTTLDKVKGQEYIALTPKYDPTEKEAEDYITRIKEEAKKKVSLTSMSIQC